jgi:hypothetical protein
METADEGWEKTSVFPKNQFIRLRPLQLEPKNMLAPHLQMQSSCI